MTVEEWIKELGLPETEQKTMLELIGKGGEKAQRYILENQLRQSDYSKKFDALQADVKKKEADLAAKAKKEDEYHNSLAAWDTKRKKELEDATAARQKAEAALATAREKANKLATEFEIPADQVTSLFEGAPVTQPNNQPTHQQFDPKELDSRFVTQDMFRTEAKAYARLATLIPSLERSHFRLFGDAAEAPNWEELIEKTVQTGGKKTLQQVYEEEYKVADKRKELDTAAIEARVKRERQEAADQERAKILGENPALGNNVRTGEREGSPVLSLARKQAEASNQGKPPISSGQSAVQAAVTAFNTGKYKTGDNKAA